MIKLIAYVLVACVIVSGGSYFGFTWAMSGAAKRVASAPEGEKLARLSMKPISVPMASDGRISGYVVTQIGIVGREADFKRRDIKPDVFVYDAVFSAIFADKRLDLTAEKRDVGLAEFRTQVKEAVNKRLGAEVVRDVIIESFAVVPADQVRGRNKAGSSKSSGF